MAPSPDPHLHLPLTPLSFHILLALAEQETHGYGLMKSVRERSQGRLTPATGTVYLALQRLEDGGMIEDSARAAEDDRRRYYRLTGFGRKVVRAEADRLANLVGLAAQHNLVSRGPLAALTAQGRRRG